MWPETFVHQQVRVQQKRERYAHEHDYFPFMLDGWYTADWLLPYTNM